MAASHTTIGLFIDYDNLPAQHKRAGVLDITRRALFKVPPDGITARTACFVRLYGGWYEGSSITPLAERLTAEVQRDFPAHIRLPCSVDGNPPVIATTGILATSLLQDPGHHLFNTFRRKGKPCNVRVTPPTEVDCADHGCVLPMMRLLLKSGTCPKSGCAVTADDLVYRHEQKLVDTMLCCDLLCAANGIADHILLISGDDDFLPPLRSLAQRGISATRYHPKPGYTPQPSLPPGYAQILELDL